MQQRILAIDPASKCGWAHSNGSSGVWSIGRKKGEGDAAPGIKLRGELNRVAFGPGIDVIAFEAVRNAKSIAAMKFLARLESMLLFWADDHQVETIGYSPGTIKKHATGKGNASKDAMVFAAETKLATIVTDDNEADALWILNLAQVELAGQA